MDDNLKDSNSQAKTHDQADNGFDYPTVRKRPYKKRPTTITTKRVCAVTLCGCESPAVRVGPLDSSVAHACPLGFPWLCPKAQQSES